MKIALTLLATLTLAAGLLGERPSGRDTSTTYMREV